MKMANKLNKHLNEYARIPNNILNNKTITLKAKGLFALIESKPNGWRFSVSGLASQTKESVNAVSSAIKELELLGVLERKRYQDKKGYWQIEYNLYEITNKHENPVTENPIQENPDTGKPLNIVKKTKKEIISKKDIVSKDTIGETPKKVPNPDIDHLMEYWEITVGYAIQGKKQANRYACNNLIKKLTVAGVEQVINGVALAHGDKYAPKISDFCSLQAKLNDLILWGKNYGNNKSFIKI